MAGQLEGGKKMSLVCLYFIRRFQQCLQITTCLVESLLELVDFA